MSRRGALRAATVVLCAAVIVAACSANSPGNPTGGKIHVVVAENSWGSIAAQLGGDRVDVTSIVTSPDTDPHDYEPTAKDGRAIAGAQYVIFNGLGYDTWASKAVDANPAPGRRLLDVGAFLGLQEGDNPHRWYFPGDVERVIAQMTADYKALAPNDAAYFDQQRDAFESTALKPYKDLLALIEEKYAGTPVGASESIVAGLAEATGLNLLTPPSFLRAISEGADPTAQDKAAADAQVTGKQIKVFVFNSQNSIPDVRALVDDARANGVEVATITETPPENVPFQDWQTAQLQRLADALAAATGR